MRCRAGEHVDRRGRMVAQMCAVSAELKPATLVDLVIAGTERKADSGGW